MRSGRSAAANNDAARIPSVMAPLPAEVSQARPGIIGSGSRRGKAPGVYWAHQRTRTRARALSPFNKRRGECIDEYRAKRARTLNSTTHLIEVDLLRGGERPGAEVADPPLDCDYVLLVNRFRADAPRLSDIWPVSLNEPLPLVPVPLLSSDPDVALDLGGAARAAYAGRGYGWRIDYAMPVPPPPLRPEMARWVAEHVRA
jgi:hypothetical protein